MLWLDLEIREDIDDVLTLVWALENKYEPKYISIHNPSIKELTVVQNILSKLNCSSEIIISGEITSYEKDIHISLEKYLTPALNSKTTNLTEFLLTNKIEDDLTVFCGGSLYTLSKLIEKNPNIKAFIQGGYAGSNIVPNEIALKKFRNREAVPTWNLNLDIEASDYVLKNHKNNIYFISKNICHKSIISQSMLKKEDSLFQTMLFEYYEHNDKEFRKKTMHDLLAFFAIDTDVIEFKEIELFHGEEERPKWKSVLTENSKKFISVDFDYELFLKKALRN